MWQSEFLPHVISAFPSYGEDEMKSLLNTSVALGLLLAAPLTTSAAASASAPTMHRTHPHHRANFADAKALAPLWAAPAAAAPYSAHDIDGLSRNPDDCAKYGCIDNGGS
jgi:hypothetical protein